MRVRVANSEKYIKKHITHWTMSGCNNGETSYSISFQNYFSSSGARNYQIQLDGPLPTHRKNNLLKPAYNRSKKLVETH